MTIQGNTICSLIQSFPVLLILAQKQNRCLETHFVYKQPTPTQSPEYYQALDALFQNLYGHETQPCSYSSKYGTKPCHGYSHGSHGTGYSSHGTGYSSHGTGYNSHGTGYGSHGTGYSSHGTGYGSHGYGGYGSHGPYGSYGYGSHGVYLPIKKGNMYSGNITYGHGYASAQSYTNNKYKVVVKKTRISTRRKKSQKLRTGFLSNIRNKVTDTIDGAIDAVGNILHPHHNRPISKQTGIPIKDTTVVVKTTEKQYEHQKPNVNQDRLVNTTQKPNVNQDRPVSTTPKPNVNQDRPDLKPVNSTTAYAGPPCTSINQGQGMCIELQFCPPLFQVFNEKPPTIKSTYILKKSACGGLNGFPMVCCPIEADHIPPTTTKLSTTTSTLPPTTTLPVTTTILPSVTSTRKAKPLAPNYYALPQVGEICTTVYNSWGSCIDVFSCMPFKELLLPQEIKKPENQVLLRKSACGFRETTPQVCCPLPLQDTNAPKFSTAEKPQSNEDFLPALPEPPVCGISNASFNRVVGGVPAKLGSFPWMALLGYRDLSIAQGMRWNCGGSLISKRHVLTAAHCIHRLEDQLYLVRLGELDLAREDEGATPIDVPIKTMYKHEQYTRNNPLFNDIGILVLQRDVQFTNLIKPICLIGPTSKWRADNFENYTPFVAGWGDVQWRGIKASHMQVAQVPVLENRDCEEVFKSHYAPRSRALFSQQAMCAGYSRGQIDACSGDSGGPLMQPLELEQTRTFTYYAVGVISLGIHCAEANRPGLYSRVSYYMPWIEQKILGRAL